MIGNLTHMKSDDRKSDTQVRRGRHLGKLEVELTLAPITQEEYDQVQIKKN